LKKGDQDLIKKTNMTTVLEKIRTEGPISRASISRVTGLSRSTCSIIVDELISEGLVLETGKDESSGGRKAILLKLNYEGRRAIGIKVMQSSITAALVDLSGRIIEMQSEVISPDCSELDFLGSLLKLVNFLISYEKNETNEIIFGIGIGIGGKIDSKNGVLLESSILRLKNIYIGKTLEDKTGIPVYLENDVNAFTIGEKYFGAGKNYNNFLCISLGQGIGAGIIIDDLLFRGSHHIAGEFGHIRITDREDSLFCTCGKKGCLEAYAADKAIQDYYRDITGSEVSIERVVALAEQGEAPAKKAFGKAGSYLGTGISTLINLFDPETIIIGGEGASYYKYMRNEVARTIKENVVYGLSDEIEIKPVLFDDNLWVRGVAALVVREVFRKEV
jgi:N-acetylglucosamine repressor